MRDCNKPLHPDKARRRSLRRVRSWPLSAPWSTPPAGAVDSRSGRPAARRVYVSHRAQCGPRDARSAARHALALGAREHGGTSSFPVVADRFPLFPPLAACL